VNVTGAGEIEYINTCSKCIACVYKSMKWNILDHPRSEAACYIISVLYLSVSLRR